MVVFLSVIPLQLPPLDGVGFNVDKLAHSFAYFVLATCVGMALWIDWKKGYLFHGFSHRFLLWHDLGTNSRVRFVLQSV